MYLVFDDSARSLNSPIVRDGERQCLDVRKSVGRFGVYLDKLTVLVADNSVCLAIISDSSVCLSKSRRQSRHSDT